MASRARITLGIALLLAVLAMIIREIHWLAALLTFFGLFLIVWGRLPSETETSVAQLPGGVIILKGLDQLDMILVPRDQALEKMTSAQVLAAQEMAKRCEQSNYKKCDKIEANQSGSPVTSATSRIGIVFPKFFPPRWGRGNVPTGAVIRRWHDFLDPWGDEWFNLTTAPKPIDQIISAVANNIHPPLQFVLLHYWIEIPWPASPLATMRAMSAVWALIATLVIYFVWLRRESLRYQAMFLALWVLSPCLLLRSRMARSYSMQLALALLAIYTALLWTEQPRNWKRVAAYLLASGALLYTHYLSGLAVAAGVCVNFLLKKRVKLAATQVGLLALLYVPWMPTLVTGLKRWWIGGSLQTYEGGSIISDQIVRLAYLFVSFSFGETVSPVTVLLGVALTPFLLWAIWGARLTRPPWLAMVLSASIIAWIGVSRIEQFVFGPTQLLFALPFFLMLVVRQINRPVFASLLVVYIAADYAYFSGSGFLVKPYATPYKEMARTISNASSGKDAILAVDPFGQFTAPLLSRLEPNVHVIFLEQEAYGRELLEAAQSWQATTTIWLWRRTTDTSPGKFVTLFERRLSATRDVREYNFMPYTLAERMAERLLRGPNQPEYYYQLSEFQPRK
jgi:hypothetical protein